jgi:hypothetical protein
MTTTVTERQQRRIRHIGAISHGGVAVAARRAAATRRELSPPAKAALVEYAARSFAPGTVLKAGSEDLTSAEIWSLLLAGPERPRLVKG